MFYPSYKSIQQQAGLNFQNLWSYLQSYVLLAEQPLVMEGFQILLELIWENKSGYKQIESYVSELVGMTVSGRYFELKSEDIMDEIDDQEQDILNYKEIEDSNFTEISSFNAGDT